MTMEQCNYIINNGLCRHHFPRSFIHVLGIPLHLQILCLLFLLDIYLYLFSAWGGLWCPLGVMYNMYYIETVQYTINNDCLVTLWKLICVLATHIPFSYILSGVQNFSVNFYLIFGLIQGYLEVYGRAVLQRPFFSTVSQNKLALCCLKNPIIVTLHICVCSYIWNYPSVNGSLDLEHRLESV